jgi:hypothetical protein
MYKFLHSATMSDQAVDHFGVDALTREMHPSKEAWYLLYAGYSRLRSGKAVNHKRRNPDVDLDGRSTDGTWDEITGGAVERLNVERLLVSAEVSRTGEYIHKANIDLILQYGK